MNNPFGSSSGGGFGASRSMQQGFGSQQQQAPQQQGFGGFGGQQQGFGGFGGFGGQQMQNPFQQAPQQQGFGGYGGQQQGFGGFGGQQQGFGGYGGQQQYNPYQPQQYNPYQQMQQPQQYNPYQQQMQQQGYGGRGGRGYGRQQAEMGMRRQQADMARSQMALKMQEPQMGADFLKNIAGYSPDTRRQLMEERQRDMARVPGTGIDGKPLGPDSAAPWMPTVNDDSRGDGMARAAVMPRGWNGDEMRTYPSEGFGGGSNGMDMPQVSASMDMPQMSASMVMPQKYGNLTKLLGGYGGIGGIGGGGGAA